MYTSALRCGSLIISQVLRLEPNDADAVKNKLFLLLQTEQYQAALSLIDNEGKSGSWDFERSYSFYRLQREEEAKRILTKIKSEKGEDDRGVMHLKAQLVRIYCILLRDHTHDIFSAIARVHMRRLLNCTISC